MGVSYGGHSDLMPWAAAVFIVYGFVIVLLAAVLGIPGIVWANRLAARLPQRRARTIKFLGKVGTYVLSLGFVAAMTVVILEAGGPKDSVDGGVKSSAVAASATPAASATSSARTP